jgi:hypothetical protein
MRDNIKDGFNPDDLVFYQEGGNIMSGGFSINNMFLSGNQPVLKTMNSSKFQEGGSISSIFKDLAVPAGLFHLQQNPTKHFLPSTFGSNEVIEDTLYDKLLKLMEPDNDKRKKQTKKVKNSKNNKTKRNKKT